MEQQYFQPNENPNKHNKWFIGIFVALLAALLLSTMAGETIKNIFNSLLAGLTPILIALVIAFLFLKPMNFIENKLLKNFLVGNSKSQKYKRMISLTVLYLLLFGIIAGIMIAAVPSIVNLVQQFTDPTKLEELMVNLKELVITVVKFFGFSQDDAVNISNTVAEAIKNYINDFTTSFNLENVFGIVSTVFSSIIGFLIAFLLLKDKELIANTAKRYTYAYRQRKHAEEAIQITRRTKDMLDQYIITNLIICVIVFVIALIGYVIMGVPYAFMMALILGVLCLVPYIGGFIAAVPLLMVTLMAGDVNLFLIAFVYSIAEWALITTFLPPMILSKRTNTRAIIMVLALIVGGAMFGVIGMILSGPIAAVITTVLNERMHVREARREHEEMVQAGIIDKNFYDVSEILDLTQENEQVTVIEQEEDDFKKLQSLKHQNEVSADAKDKKTKKIVKRNIKSLQLADDDEPVEEKPITVNKKDEK